MKLLVEELKGNEPLEQGITPLKNRNVEAVRLHLYKHSNPIGKIRLELRNEFGLITTGEWLELDSISEAPYFHGMVRLNLKAQLKANTHYILRVVSEDYTFSELNYIGVCRDFDFQTYPKSQEDLASLISPLHLEIWNKE